MAHRWQLKISSQVFDLLTNPIIAPTASIPAPQVGARLAKRKRMEQRAARPPVKARTQPTAITEQLPGAQYGSTETSAHMWVWF